MGGYRILGTTTMITLARTTSQNKDFQELIRLLDEGLWERYGEIQGPYVALNKVENNQTVIVAYVEGIAQGCGCFKQLQHSVVEIKRMFVREEARGKGIASALLKELESWAIELGNTIAILETGTKQIEAIGMYKKSGYSQMDNYEPYIGMPYSVCFQKDL